MTSRHVTNRDYSLEKLIEHDIVNVRRARSVKLNNGLRVGVVAVKRPELTSRVSKQHQKVLCFAARDFLQNFLLGIAIHHAREYTILDGVEENATI
jgi:hypothetical protein